MSARLASLDKLLALIQKVDAVVTNVESLGERFNSVKSEQRDLRDVLTLHGWGPRWCS